MKISGIYKIQSKVKPRRIYIGSATIIQRRWNDHFKRLRKGIHDNIKLQRHYNKYGESDLQFSILIGCEKENLISIEQFFIDAFNPYFNLVKRAGSCLGYKHTAETIKNMSTAQLNRHYHCTEEHKRKISEANKGKNTAPHSEEVKRIQSESHKGKKQSKETIEKRRLAMLGKKRNRKKRNLLNY